MALKLDILANTSKFVSEMKKSGTSVEDVSDALDDLVRDGDKAGDKLERSFRDIAKEAKRAETSVSDVGDKGFKKASAGMDDFKGEARQTSAEVAASFDGSAESIAGGFQELAANALSGFGPAGAAAGLALAAGIGIATQVFTGMGEQSEALKEQIKSNFRDMAEEGIAAWQSMEEQNKRLTDAYAEHDADIQKIADTIGLPFEVVADAWAGSADAYKLVKAAQEELLSGIEGGTETAKGAIYTGITKPLDEVVNGYDKARENAKRYEEQIATNEQANRDQIQRTRDADQARYEAMKQQYERPIQTKVVVTLDANQAWGEISRLTSPKYVDMRVKPRGTTEWQ